ncbi:MAG: SDR family oxidoreductase [Desulfomonile tiedjei]|nr:SDR family oxidoreductase [Desulfomonile tiedjei]
MDLTNRLALVTGGGRGLGKAICLIFAEKGADVVVTDVDPAMAEKTAAEVRRKGRKSAALKLDVSEPRDFDEAADATLKVFGRLDIWVNNAGIGSRAMLDEMTVEQWDRVVDVNLRGTFLGTRAAARIMKTRKSGRIINMSSRAGKGGSYGHINYASSKAGIIALTKSAARELGGFNITVNALLPGFIETDLTKNLTNEIKRPDQIVLGRPGRPEDVAYAAAFLASDEAEWITGICLEVTGGTGMFSG